MNARPVAVVVDDSEPFLLYLSILLKRMNLEVLPVDNAAEALEIARVTRPHLVTMEMTMPGMDGLEALRAIRADEELADLPVIMISSYQDKNRQWEALSLGCIDVLDKPVDLRRLHKAVQRCDLYAGGRRRYLRAPFERTIGLHHQGKLHKVSSVTLSERGIFIRTHLQLAKGAHVEVDLPLPSNEMLQVGGSVIYGKALNGGASDPPPGFAIKFDRLTLNNIRILSELVEELLIDDIVAEQTEPVVRPRS
ncbi:MAG: response regulator [Desulfuromonadales bacterium]|jgi:CheY-like chemotaxis protein|nr:response regulator [Desulfuromonadales bacterium]